MSKPKLKSRQKFSLAGSLLKIVLIFIVLFSLGFVLLVPLLSATLILLKADLLAFNVNIMNFLSASVFDWWPITLSYGQLPPVLFSSIIYVVGAMTLFIFVVTTLGKTSNKKSVFGPSAVKTHEHGSAEVDTDERTLMTNTRTWDGTKEGALALGSGGVVYGYSQRYRLYYVSSGEDNTIILGPPKSGKTRRVLLQTLFFMGACGDSIIAIDPKGELYSKSRRYLASQGYDVWLYDLQNPNRSHLINSLTEVSSAYFENMNKAKRFLEQALDASRVGKHTRKGLSGFEPDTYEFYLTEATTARQTAREAAESRAMDIALTIIPLPVNVSNADFWSNSARGILTALILLVSTYDRASIVADLELQRRGANAQTRLFIDQKIEELPTALEPEQRSLTSVQELLNTKGKTRTVTKAGVKKTEVDMELLFNVLPDDDIAKRAYAQAKNAKDETLAGMIVSAQNELNRVMSESFASISYSSDFCLEDVAKKKTAVFVRIPDDKPAKATPAIMYITLQYQALTDLANKQGGTLSRKVAFLLEEAGSYPVPIPDLQTKVSVCRQRNIIFLFSLQEFMQLDEKYGKVSASNIRASCNTTVFLKTNLLDTAKEISARLGKYTYMETSQSSNSRKLSFLEGSVGESMRVQSRDWLTPDEVLKWPTKYGNIVFRASADRQSKGIKDVLYGKELVNPAIYPSPDLSKTPTQKALGLGSRSHDQALWAEDERIDRRALRKVVVPWQGKRLQEMPETQSVTDMGDISPAIRSLLWQAAEKRRDLKEGNGQEKEAIKVEKENLQQEGLAKLREKTDEQYKEIVVATQRDLAFARRVARKMCETAGVEFEKLDVTQEKAKWLYEVRKTIEEGLRQNEDFEYTFEEAIAHVAQEGEVCTEIPTEDYSVFDNPLAFIPEPTHPQLDYSVFADAEQPSQTIEPDYTSRFNFTGN